MDVHSKICETLKHPFATDVLEQRHAILASLYSFYRNGTSEAQAKALNEFIHVEREKLTTAQTIFVSKNIMEEVLEASRTMPDNVLIPQDVFVPNGVLVFEEPIKYTLVVDDGAYIEEWDTHSIQFNYIPDYPIRTEGEPTTYSSGIEVRLYGKWCATLSVKDNEEYRYNPDATELENIELASRLVGGQVSKHQVAYFLNRARGSASTYLDATFLECNRDEIQDDNLNDFKRTLITLFRMTYSYLAQTQEEAPRHVIKRAKRANRKILENGYLTVLRLRRVEYENGGGTHSSPKYAFRVRGHWKRAYLRSTGLPVGDPNAYRYVYVSDYIKGKTANKEFRESTRVINITN